MRIAMLLVFGVTSLVAAADEPKGKPADKDLKLLEGAWVTESMSQSGKDVGKKGVEGRTLTIKGDMYTATRPELKAVEWTITLDAGKKPKWIDLKLKDDKERTQAGIYELDGDTLKIATNNGRGDRPTSFEPGPGVVVITYKRMKKE